jgi:hypothetical protein
MSLKPKRMLTRPVFKSYFTYPEDEHFKKDSAKKCYQPGY